MRNNDLSLINGIPFLYIFNWKVKNFTREFKLMQLEAELFIRYYKILTRHSNVILIKNDSSSFNP